jgi:hypothetical protein
MFAIKDGLFDQPLGLNTEILCERGCKRMGNNRIHTVASSKALARELADNHLKDNSSLRQKPRGKREERGWN